MKYYLEDVKDVLKELDSNEDGLTCNEVNDRLLKYGKNKIEEGTSDISEGINSSDNIDIASNANYMGIIANS